VGQTERLASERAEPDDADGALPDGAGGNARNRTNGVIGA